MDTQQAVAEGTHTDGQSESKRDGQQKLTLGPNDSLEGKLTYGGSMAVDGGRAEGEVRIGGQMGVGNGSGGEGPVQGDKARHQGGGAGQVDGRRKPTPGKGPKAKRDGHARRP